MRSRSKVVHVDRFSPRKKTCRIPYPWVEERSTKGLKASQYRHAERDAREKENAASFLQLAVFSIARLPFAHGKMPGRFVRCRFKRAAAMRKRCFSVPKRPPTALFMQEMRLSPRLDTKHPDKASERSTAGGVLKNQFVGGAAALTTQAVFQHDRTARMESVALEQMTNGGVLLVDVGSHACLTGFFRHTLGLA